MTLVLEEGGTDVEILDFPEAFHFSRYVAVAWFCFQQVHAPSQ